MSRINTNVPSLIAARILTANNNALNTSLERLSTGLRINRGKDDPAGLIASETLRSELTAISAAIDNARRADNIVNVAESGLGEISALLIELEGLVDQTANSAGVSDEEVAANQLQIDSILDTINRISTSTEFQGRKLLDGSLDYTTSSVNSSNISSIAVNGARIANGAFRQVVVEVTGSAQTAQLNYTGSATGAGTTTLQVTGNLGTELVTFASGTAAASIAAAINQSSALTGVSASVSGTGASTVVRFNSTEFGANAFVSVEAINGTFTLTGGDSATRDTGVNVSARINGVQAVTNGLNASISSSALSIELELASSFATQTTTTETFEITGGGADFSISPKLGLAAKASLGIQSLASSSLGKTSIGFLSSLASGGTNQLTSKNFSTAQRVIRESINDVTKLRGRLGAFQKNTLGSAINALQVAFENTSAAESAIRDADFAVETSKLTRSQILVAASQSVLQLSNAAPQSVLGLLG